jgi:hypothetical protein
MTWDEAIQYTRGVIADECAREGISVEIRDPALLALSIRMFKLGKRNVERLDHDTLRPKVAS